MPTRLLANHLLHGYACSCFTLALSLLVAACGSEAGGDADVIEDTAPEVVACACDDGCPPNMCDVRVELASTCSLTFAVLIDGAVVGEAAPGAPYVSCEAWTCDTRLAIEVRGEGYSTGVKTLSVLLDPEVPLDCSNLGI
jgi:hypothetical protein